MGEKPVYSTAGGRIKDAPNPRAGFQRGSGPCKLRLETHGRGGKAVTVVFNLPFDEETARSLMKEMQTRFGCGATLKDSTIELRGDVRDRVEAFLAQKSVKVVRAGGAPSPKS